MLQCNYVAAILFVDLSLLSISVGEISTNENGSSDMQIVSIESVPISLIEEISMSWSSSYNENHVSLGQDNGPSYIEVGQDYMNVHFSVGPNSGLDLPSLQDEVLRQIGVLLGSDQYFDTAALNACTKEDTVMYLQLRYTSILDIEHQKNVIKTIYNAVEVDGYLGNIKVFHLYVQDIRGIYIRIDDICDFDGCPNGIECAPRGQRCIWNCSLNAGYCPEKSKCIDKQTNGFYCRCDHDTNSDRCKNMTDSIPTSLESSWTKTIVTVTASILVCVLVVCVTVKILHIYYRKQSVTFRCQTELHSDNNSLEGRVSDTVDLTNQSEFQFLLPTDSDCATLIQNGNHLPQNGQTSSTFLLVDNHEHF